MIRCHFCGRAVSDVPAACDAGWLPSFWSVAADHEVSAPVCPACRDARLLWDEESREYVRPALPCP